VLIPFKQINTIAMKKKLFTLAFLLTPTVYYAHAEISQKALQAFHTVFAGAKHVKWTEYNDHYFVSFYQNEILVKATYDKEGNMLNSMRYYGEQRLPLNILYQVEKSYPSKMIAEVTEVSNGEGTLYFIQLKDKKGWTIIKSDASGELEVTDRFADANK
jgi:hypothetical protein